MQNKLPSRKKARRLALQALYSHLVSGTSLLEIERYTLQQEAEKDDFDKAYFQDLLQGITQHLDQLEKYYMPYLDRSLEELDPIERSIFRLATYELNNRLDVPYKVVLNEALELAKSFGATESHKYINGILDKVAKELRKDEIRT